MEGEKMSKYRDAVASINLITKGEEVIKITASSLDFFDLENECDRVHAMLLCFREQVGNVCAPEYNQKSEKKADELRNRGNLKLNSSADDCVKLYTESIAHAPLHSDALSFGYANRAVALAQLKHYQEAVADNQRALIAGYPGELHYKIYSRLGKCYGALGEVGKALTCYNIAVTELDRCKLTKQDREKYKKKHIDAGLDCCSADRQQEEVIKDITQDPAIGVPKFDIPSLGESFNPELPSAADSISLQYNNTFGRHFVACRDIEIGEPVIIEKPYCAFLLKDYFYSYCSHCFKQCRTLQPCPRCSWALFCSSKCMDEAQMYHQNECVLMPSIMNNRLATELETLVARTIIRYGIKTTADFLASYKKPKRQTMGTKRTAGFNKDGKYISSDLNTIVNLCYHNVLKRDLYLGMCSVAAQLLQRLKLDNETFSYELGGFIFKLLSSPLYNGSSKIVEYHVKDSVSIHVATAIYPTYALLNHSCAPNAMYHCYGDVKVVRALRSIGKGEQIFVMYGRSFLTQPYDERHHIIQLSLHICCKCKACSLKWPMDADLPTFPIFSLPRENRIMNQMKDAHANLLKNCAVDEMTNFMVTPNTFSILKEFVEFLEKIGKTQCAIYYSIINELHLYFAKQGNRVGEIQDRDVSENDPTRTTQVVHVHIHRC